MNDKQLPHDKDLEQSLVSAALRSREAFSEASEVIANEDRFYDAACLTIWRTLREMAGKGETWDLALIGTRLYETGQLGDIGGYAGLTEIFHKEPTTLHAVKYAEKIQGFWIMRSMAILGQEMIRDVTEMSVSPSELRDSVEKRVFELGESLEIGKPITSRELAVQTMDRLERIQNGEKAGLPTGYFELDRLFTGFAPATVTLLAGRPGGGKSKLALNVTQHLGELGVPVVYYGLEMSNEEQGLRLVSSIAKLNGFKIQKNELDEDGWRLATHAANEIQHLPVYWQDKPGLKPSELLSSMRKMKRNHGIDLAIVDHILLMQADHRGGRSRNDEVGEISRMVKLAAKETGVPILALCQMNRGVEQRNDAPRLSDLRDSGNLEQDADNVIFLHRPQAEKDMPTSETVEVYVAKQRNGPTGKCELLDRKGIFRFDNMAR